MKKRAEDDKPTFFDTASKFRSWLRKNHSRSTELLVGFHKVGTGRKTLTHPEAVDQALCFGWIDGVCRRHGAGSYTIRFSPRRPRSIWSLVNIRNVKRLIRSGAMHASGLKVFNERDRKRQGLYSFENRPKVFDRTSLRAFKANAKAWSSFNRQPPGYRRLMVFYVMSAKKEETRAKRLLRLIDHSARDERVPLM